MSFNRYGAMTPLDHGRVAARRAADVRCVHVAFVSHVHCMRAMRVRASCRLHVALHVASMLQLLSSLEASANWEPETAKSAP